MGIDPKNASGLRLTDAQSRVWEIAGVMKDFNFGSLHKDVESFMLWINHKQDGLWANITVHTATSDYTKLLQKIQIIWQRDVPGVPFEYNFMDEQVQKQYESDISMSRIMNVFTMVACASLVLDYSVSPRSALNNENRKLVFVKFWAQVFPE